MEPFQEVFDFQNCRNIPPPNPVFQCRDLTISAKQNTDEDLGTLLSADPVFFPLTQPTTLQATQSTPNTPTHVANTLYSSINDPPTSPFLKSTSIPPAHLTAHDKTFFPRPPTPFIFKHVCWTTFSSTNISKKYNLINHKVALLHFQLYLEQQPSNHSS